MDTSITKTQATFRTNLIKVYENKCSICDHTTVEACHIVDSAMIEPSTYSKYCIYNGLLLCPNHHTEFDKRLITIDLWNYSDLYSNDEFIEVDIKKNQMLIKRIKVLRGAFIYLLWRMCEEKDSGKDILSTIKRIRYVNKEYYFEDDWSAIMI